VKEYYIQLLIQLLPTRSSILPKWNKSLNTYVQFMWHWDHIFL